jgi:predicted aldo/keto reductase-like oxidoreductase
MFVNGMVLSPFAGSKYFKRDIVEYFEEGLDWRLRVIPGGYFDSFMINEVELGYDDDEAAFESLIRLLERRRDSGDIRLIGISSHIPHFARKIAAAFNEIDIIMIPYNYLNRSLEIAFENYTGNASLVAMKPMVWDIYGIPFNALNNLPDPKGRLGISPIDDIASHALAWIQKNPDVKVVVCSVNNQTELEQLIQSTNTVPDSDDLEVYKNAVVSDRSRIFALSSLNSNIANERVQFNALQICTQRLGIEFPYDTRLTFSELNITQKDIDGLREKVIRRAKELGFGEYI